MRTFCLGLGAGALLTLPLSAQGLLTTFVSDPSGDAIWMCQDLDQNGSYNEPGEIAQFYDEAIGGVALSSNQAILWRPDGGLFVSDGTEDIILELLDLNGDNDANDPGEANVWFYGDPALNASGVTMASARNMWLDPDGTLFVAVSNTGGGGEDIILRLQDLDSNGDANGVGEASIYFEALPGAAIGDSIPVDILRGPDGALYYLDSGVSTTRPKGVYRLEDLDNSGTIDQPGEETPYFFVPVTGSSVFHWRMQMDNLGRMYVAETSGDVIWRFEDLNNDQSIDPVTEAEIVWTAPASSNIYAFQFAGDGEIYVAEDQTPDRLLRLFDSNNDGIFDAVTETETVYDEGLSPTDIGSPRGMALAPSGSFLGLAYCDPAVANSTGSPATLKAFGSAFVSAQDVTLIAEGMPTGEFGYFLNGTGNGVTAMPGGSPGNLCVSTAIGRYNAVPQIFNTGLQGAGSLALDLTNTPTPLGPVAIQVGETWYFQGWYRDTPNATSNFTNGIEITFF